jgi:hypothetical protein
MDDAKRDIILDQISTQLKQLGTDTRALTLRLEELHGKLDAAIEIRERLAALEARLSHS